MSTWGKELAVNILTVSSVVSAATFGALGLFTDYKKDGRVTRYGFIAALGILLSAVMSITVGLLQGRIESERKAEAAKAEKAKRDEENKRFGAQINRLSQVSAALGSLMTESQRSLLLTEQIGIQQRTSTDQTLRTMWEDANRIDPSTSIAANVNYRCNVAAGVLLPPLLKDGAWMDIYLLPAGEARRRVASYKAFSFRSALDVPFQGKRSWSANGETGDPRGDEGVRLKTLEQQVFGVGTTTSSFMQIVQVSRFGPFYAQGIWPYSAPSSWRGLVLEAVVKGPAPLDLDALARLLNKPVRGREALVDIYNGVDAQVDKRTQLSVLPCDALLQVRVNGRLVAEPMAPLLYYQNKSARMLMLKFPIVDIPTSSVPLFDSIGARDATGPNRRVAAPTARPNR